MDESGYAHFAAIENLASRARVTPDEAKIAIETFLAPDPNSSNPENEGRRIERVPGGYLILNAKVYRELATRHQQKEQNRERVNRYRAQNKPTRKRTITDHYTPLHSVCVSASASAFDSLEGSGEPLGEIVEINIENALKWLAVVKAAGADFTEVEVRSAFAILKSKGFRWGERAIADWRAALERQIYSDRERKENHYGTSRSNSKPASNRNTGTYNDNPALHKQYESKVVRASQPIPNKERSDAGKNAVGNDPIRH